ncbi:MAG: cytosine deaminase related metal-dependent hydrolase [Haloquadratum sp. J07HQX50]|jgi:Cytosine deaminase and related metal-dependent hydrolases|nr:MAG: cytosine deaminase related metal-dependent hydrolase [Haloquadratum sp. J07HQX50]
MDSSSLLLSGGKILTPSMNIITADIHIDQSTGVIEAIEAGLDPSRFETSLDVSGCVCMPGLVNAHTHIAMTLLRGYSDDKPLNAWLREDIWPVEAQLTTEHIRAGTELGLVEMIRSGTTAFADMYFEIPETVAAVDAAGMRARLGHGIVTVDKEPAAARADIEKGLTVAQEFQQAADGRIQTAFMPHSLTTVDDDLLADGAERATAENMYIHLHANETSDEVNPIVERTGERPIQHAETLGLLGPKTFLAHGVHVNMDEIATLARTDTAVIHCPASNMKLASGIAPVSHLREAGVTVGLGTDGVASNNDLDMFSELQDAALLAKLGADDAAALPAGEAIKMATADSAAAISLPGGRLIEGGVADIAVVDLDTPHFTPQHDVVSHLAYVATGADVRHTICDGSILMRDRTLQTLDAEAIQDTAETAATDLLARI